MVTANIMCPPRLYFLGFISWSLACIQYPCNASSLACIHVLIPVYHAFKYCFHGFHLLLPFESSHIIFFSSNIVSLYVVIIVSVYPELLVVLSVYCFPPSYTCYCVLCILLGFPILLKIQQICHSNLFKYLICCLMTHMISS